MTEEIGTTYTEHCYIVKREGVLNREPIVKGTRTPVRAIVRLWRAGYAPDEIPSAMPHLSMAEVFDALSYYSDHQEEIHEYIKLNRVPSDLIHPSVREV